MKCDSRMQRAILYRIFTGCITITIILIVIYTVSQNYEHIEETKWSHNLKESSVYTKKYENIINEIPRKQEYKRPIRGEKNIIFLETSCAVNESSRGSFDPPLILNSQQACAIESTARTNPDASIYLFYTCPLDNGSVARSSELVRQVFDYPNVHVWYQNMSSFFEGTPLEVFYKTGVMKTSKYPASHSSDVLRFLVLWKFGGTYLDLDFIVRRSLISLGTDYACAEDLNYIASGAMSFSTSGVGKALVDKCVEEMRTNFNGKIWNHNGPGLITRILKEHCGVNQTELMGEKACRGFTVHPSTVFYPIMYKYLLFYDESKSRDTMVKIEPSHAVHLWNSLVTFQGGDVTIRRGSEQPIVLMLKQYCPIAYENTEMKNK